MTALHIDLETRSTVDLRKTGVYVYADDPSTEILMAAWAIDDEPVRIWYSRTEAIPDSLWEALTDPTAPVAAHSAQFERIMLRKRFPSLQTIERWDCTAARAAAMGLPRTLEVAAKALDLSYQKDAEGHDLMMRMCKPRRPRKGEDPDGIYWFDDDERMARLAAYCAGTWRSNER